MQFDRLDTILIFDLETNWEMKTVVLLRVLLQLLWSVNTCNLIYVL